MKPANYFSTEVSKLGALAQFNDPKVRVVISMVFGLVLAYKLPLPINQTLGLFGFEQNFLSNFILKMLLAFVLMIVLVFIPAIKIYGIPTYKLIFNAFMFNPFWLFSYFKKTEIKELKETEFRFVESINGYYDLATKTKLIRIYKVSAVEYSSLTEEQREKINHTSSNLFNNYGNYEFNQVLTVKRIATKKDFKQNVIDKTDIMRSVLLKNDNKTLAKAFKSYQENVKNFSDNNQVTPKIDNYYIISESFKYGSIMLMLKKLTSPKSITLQELQRAKSVLNSRETKTITNLEKQGHKVERIEPSEIKEVVIKLISLN